MIIIFDYILSLNDYYLMIIMIIIWLLLWL